MAARKCLKAALAQHSLKGVKCLLFLGGLETAKEGEKMFVSCHDMERLISCAEAVCLSVLLSVRPHGVISAVCGV